MFEIVIKFVGLIANNSSQEENWSTADFINLGGLTIAIITLLASFYKSSQDAKQIKYLLEKDIYIKDQAMNADYYFDKLFREFTTVDKQNNPLNEANLKAKIDYIEVYKKEKLAVLKKFSPERYKKLSDVLDELKNVFNRYNLIFVSLYSGNNLTNVDIINGKKQAYEELLELKAKYIHQLYQQID